MQVHAQARCAFTQTLHTFSCLPGTEPGYSAQAEQEVVGKYGNSPEVETFIDLFFETNESKILLAAALSRNGNVERALKKAIKRQQLPIGPIATENDLRVLFNAFVASVRQQKMGEMERHRKAIARYGQKAQTLDAMSDLKNRLLLDATLKAKHVTETGKQLENLYDSSHGAYGFIPDYLVLRRKGLPRRELIVHIRDFHQSRGYVEVPHDAGQESNVQLTSIYELGDLYLLNYRHIELHEELSRRVKGPVLYVGCAEAFERDAWAYILLVQGEEVDRHCSNPLVKSEIGELLEEGESEFFVRGLCTSWCGDALALSHAFEVDAEVLRPYLLQLYGWELSKIWKNKRMFVSFKAFQDDPHSLASPWLFMDLLKRLGGGGNVRAIWDRPSESVWFRRPAHGQEIKA